jgi:hypothetical protein
MEGHYASLGLALTIGGSDVATLPDIVLAPEGIELSIEGPDTCGLYWFKATHNKPGAALYRWADSQGARRFCLIFATEDPRREAACRETVIELERARTVQSIMRETGLPRIGVIRMVEKVGTAQAAAAIKILVDLFGEAKGNREKALQMTRHLLENCDDGQIKERFSVHAGVADLDPAEVRKIVESGIVSFLTRLK